MPYVFISYSHQDGIDYANELFTMLEAYNLTPWRDKQAITASYSWSQEIDDAIDDSYAMVVIGTKAAMQSVGVTYEWAKAMGMHIPVIALDVDNVTKDIHQFRKSHYLNYHDPEFSELLLRDLRRIKDEDGITKVRIPYEADSELKALAHQAFDSTLSFEENKQAIQRIADMVDEPLAYQILANGLNKREYSIVNHILTIMQTNQVKPFEPYVLPKLLDFLLIKDLSSDSRLVSFQTHAVNMLSVIGTSVLNKLYNILQSNEYPTFTQTRIFDVIWRCDEFGTKAQVALGFMLAHDDEACFKYGIANIQKGMRSTTVQTQPHYIEYVKVGIQGALPFINDKSRLNQILDLIKRQRDYSNLTDKIRTKLKMIT